MLNLYSIKSWSSPKETLTVKYLLEKGTIQKRKSYSLANHAPAKEEQHNLVFQTMLHRKKLDILDFSRSLVLKI